MKKIKTLLVLSGLAVSLLAGCGGQSSSSKVESSTSITSRETSNSESSSSSSSSTSSATSTSTSSSTPTSSSSQIVEALSSIAIVSEPTKKSYRVGEQFNAEGLAVKAVYNTGREENLAADAYQLSGFDSEAAGIKTITVTYQAKTATFTVSVFGKDGIEITAAPDKTVYGIGDEFDATGLKVSQKYGDGSVDELAATEYTVSGFDSATAGDKEITVTAGEQTATFTVSVYSKAWSNADKEISSQYLLFDLPYFLGFSLELGGLTYVDSGEEAVKWVEAKTAYSTTEADLDAYKAQIEAIKTTAGEQAWNPYETTGSNSSYTDDIDFLGFDAESEVYQYARWYNDNVSANGFQILSIGLDPDGKLLAVTTVCILPLAGYGLDGSGYRAIGTDSETGEEYDMVEEFCSIEDARSQSNYDEAYDLDLGWTEVLIWPEYSRETVIFLLAKNHDSPYTGINLYSNEFDAGSCIFQITNRFAEEGAEPYTADTLAGMLAAYAEKGINFVEDSESYNVTVYTARVEVNGYTVDLLYYFNGGYIILEADLVSFSVPFRGDVYVNNLASKFAAYAESASKTFENIPVLSSYNEEANVATAGYFIGYADNATTGFVNGITLTERSFVTGSLRQSGLLTAAEINALTWTTLDSYKAGTATVGTEDNVQYEITNEAGNELAFISGDFSYAATYDAENKTLKVVKTSNVDDTIDPVTIVLTEDNFTAASGTNNDPFAGTWDNGEFKLKLTKSKDIITQQRISFVVTKENGSTIAYAITLHVGMFDTSGRVGVVCMFAVACTDAPVPPTEG